MKSEAQTQTLHRIDTRDTRYEIRDTLHAKGIQNARLQTPPVGENIKSGNIVAILVAVGDAVKKTSRSWKWRPIRLPWRSPLLAMEPSKKF